MEQTVTLSRDRAVTQPKSNMLSSRQNNTKVLIYNIENGTLPKQATFLLSFYLKTL